MTTKDKQDIAQIVGTQPSTLGQVTNKLEQQAGFFGRMSANASSRKDAANALANIRSAKIEGATQIAQTGIAISTSLIKAEMLANAMPALGTVINTVNQQMAVVDSMLVNNNTAETVSHMQNRHENVVAINQLLQKGLITADEAEQLLQMAQGNAVDNISRSFDRLTKAKTATQTLCDMATTGIESIARRVKNT